MAILVLWSQAMQGFTQGTGIWQVRGYRSWREQRGHAPGSEAQAGWTHVHILVFISQVFTEQLLCPKHGDKAVNEADPAPTLPLRELRLACALPTTLSP